MFRSWMPGSSRWLSRATRARRKVAVCGEQHGGTASEGGASRSLQYGRTRAITTANVSTAGTPSPGREA
ncbi:hypothetical protein ADL09_26360 [Streptomyces sp. NRRL F-7442]|nr:hypothetical protein ADL09_26360 [Streptomyces sp. NRRL F-7442]